MKNKGEVTLNNNRIIPNTPNGEIPICLYNGSLVLHFSKSRRELLGAYIVTSFRDHKNRYAGDNSQSYCSLIDMETGYIKFEERCSRNTTMKRVLSHLSPGDCAGTEALKRGEFIEVYTRNNYAVDFSFNELHNEGWHNE